MKRSLSPDDIDEIYHRLLFQRDVTAAFAHLMRLFDAHSGSVMKLKTDAKRNDVISIHNICEESYTAYQSELGKQDPFMMEAARRPTTDFLTLRTVVDWTSFRNTDYAQHVLKPGDIGENISFRTRTHDGQIGMSLYRDETRPFTGEDLHVGRQLHAHIARCVRLYYDTPAGRHCKFQTYRLTAKETDIIQYLFDGVEYEEISAQLRISRNTLKTHMKNIFNKCEVRSLAQLILKLW